MFETYDDLPVDTNRERNRAFWLKFLYAEGLTEDDWNLAITLADNWDTCACGSLDDGIPRKYDSPDDIKLNRLGIDFVHKIMKHDLKASREVFDAIQKRAIEVLRRTLFDPPCKRGVDSQYYESR